MKNKILIFLALNLAFSFSGYLFGQNETGIERKIKEEMNQRINKNGESSQKDTVLNKVAKYINDNKLYKSKNRKEIVRQYLEGQRIYDSEIYISNFKIRKNKNVDLNTLIEESDELGQVLRNKKNMLKGVSVTSNKRKYIIQLVLTEHIIDFKEVSYNIPIPHILQSDIKFPSTITIVGESSIPNLFYSKNKEVKNDSIGLQKTEVFLTDESQFELELDYDNKDIIFYNEKGKKIAIISNSNKIKLK